MKRAHTVAASALAVLLTATPCLAAPVAGVPDSEVLQSSEVPRPPKGMQEKPPLGKKHKCKKRKAKPQPTVTVTVRATVTATPASPVPSPSPSPSPSPEPTVDGGSDTAEPNPDETA